MKLPLYLLLSAAMAVATGCNSHSHSDHGHEHEHEHEHEHSHDHEGHDEHDHDHDHEGHEGHDEHDEHEGHGPDVIVLAPAKAEAAGVKVDTLAPTPFRSVIKTSGRVMPASGDETTVAATVGGILHFSRPITEGSEIGRGAAVASISTSSLPDGDVAGRARIAYEQAKAQYDRAESLLADRLITRSEHEAAKAEYERARLAYEAAGKESGSKGVAVVTPAGGFVKQLMAREGDYVEVGQPIMTVTKNRNLYLRADVAERDFAKMRDIASARFIPAYASKDKVYDLDEMGGRVVSYGRTAGGSGGAFIPMTFEFANTGDIMPDSYAEVYLIGRERGDALTVPVEALTEEQGVMFVFVREDEDCYRKKEVKTGSSDGRRVEILSGLNAGDVVVTEGTVYVRLAGASGAIPGHTHNH